MSYCRWSSDDHQCDVYVYDSVGDFIAIHVAGIRFAFKEPLPPPSRGLLPPGHPLYQKCLEDFMERHNKVMAMVEAADRVPIGLPYDGESFQEPDEAAAADRLEMLRTLGYRVPQQAIDTLRAEAAETKEQP